MADNAIKAANKAWNVVVIGRWNASILTPVGIARRLFGIPEDTEFQVFFATDAVLPPKVNHAGLTVIVGSDTLTIELEKNDYSELSRAMTMAKKAMDELPVTPTTAAGFNIHLIADAQFAPFASLFRADWDSRIENAAYKIVRRRGSRTVQWNDGEVTINITQKADQGFETQVNFNRTSNNMGDLRKWLSLASDEVSNEVEKVLKTLAD